MYAPEVSKVSHVNFSVTATGTCYPFSNSKPTNAGPKRADLSIISRFGAILLLAISSPTHQSRLKKRG